MKKLLSILLVGLVGGFVSGCTIQLGGQVKQEPAQANVQAAQQNQPPQASVSGARQGNGIAQQKADASQQSSAQAPSNAKTCPEGQVCDKGNSCKKWLYQTCNVDADCHTSLVCRRGFGTGTERRQLELLGSASVGHCIAPSRAEFWARMNSYSAIKALDVQVIGFEYPAKDRAQKVPESAENQKARELVCALVGKGVLWTAQLIPLVDPYRWTNATREARGAHCLAMKNRSNRNNCFNNLEETLQAELAFQRGQNVKDWIASLCPNFRGEVLRTPSGNSKKVNDPNSRGARIVTIAASEPGEPGEPAVPQCEQPPTVVREIPAETEKIQLSAGGTAYHDGRSAAMLGGELWARWRALRWMVLGLGGSVGQYTIGIKGRSLAWGVAGEFRFIPLSWLELGLGYSMSNLGWDSQDDNDIRRLHLCTLSLSFVIPLGVKELALEGGGWAGVGQANYATVEEGKISKLVFTGGVFLRGRLNLFW